MSLPPAVLRAAALVAFLPPVSVAGQAFLLSPTQDCPSCPLLPCQATSLPPGPFLSFPFRIHMGFSSALSR